MRFLDPDAGAVRLDGHDIRDLTLASLRRNVALLLQDAPLIDGTVRENVAYGGPEASDTDILAALASAGLTRRTVRLDTPCRPARPRPVGRPAPPGRDGPRAAAGRAGADPRRADRGPGPRGRSATDRSPEELMRDRATLPHHPRPLRWRRPPTRPWSSPTAA